MKNCLVAIARFAVLASLYSTYGCGANFNSVYRKFETEDDSVLVDVKQRMIAITTVKEQGIKDSSGNASTLTRTLICAEPSPDALSAMSAAASASGSYKEVSAQIAGSISEVASNIGLRTQTIQLLRDGMYRICEAYLNGALPPKEYVAEQRRYQVMTAGLLAIESLTSVVTPKQVVLRSDSTASTGKNVIEAEKNLKEANDNLKAADIEEGKAVLTLEASKKAQKDFETTLDSNPSNWTTGQKAKDDELKRKIDSDQKSADEKATEKKNRQATVDVMQTILDQSRTSITARVGTSGSIDSASCSRSCSSFSEGNNNKMLETVQGIVTGMFNPDVIYECINYYKDSALIGPAEGRTSEGRNSLDKFCAKVFDVGQKNPEKFFPAYSR
jgi:hypothetical protein